jgi:pilus assembly protein Flp/PilA
MDWEGVKRTMMLTHVKEWMLELVRDEDGASLVEYILLVALIAVVCIAAVTFLGKAAKARFESTATAINSTS